MQQARRQAGPRPVREARELRREAPREEGLGADERPGGQGPRLERSQGHAGLRSERHLEAGGGT